MASLYSYRAELQYISAMLVLLGVEEAGCFRVVSALYSNPYKDRLHVL